MSALFVRRLGAIALTSLIAACVLNDVGPVIEREGLREIRDYLEKKQTT